MAHLFRCPSCGHKICWPDDLSPRAVRCTACNHTFTASHEDAIGRVAERARKTERQNFVFKLSRMVGVDITLLLDGAIGAALGGILAGILIGGIAGMFRDDLSIEGMGIGAVVTGIFSGLVFGILAGIIVGLLVGCSANIITHLVGVPMGSVPLVAGLIAGAAVAVLVGSIWWSLVGAGLGACGTWIWRALSSWAESAMNSFAYGQHDLSSDGSEMQRWEITEPMFAAPRGLRGLGRVGPRRN